MKKLYTLTSNGRDTSFHTKNGMKQKMRRLKGYKFSFAKTVRIYKLELLDEIMMNAWDGEDQQFIFSVDNTDIRATIQAETLPEGYEKFVEYLRITFPESSYSLSEIHVTTRS